MPERREVEIFAHRGDSGTAPENTLAAFRLAVASGAHGVELDVQAAREGEPVVIHDEWLQRTTDGRGAVGEHTLRELRRLDAGAWFGPDFAGERVPTLAEVLELLAPTPLRINLELKTNVVPYPGLVERVLGQVAGRGLGPRMILSSRNHHTLAEARALAPELECGALVLAHMIRPWEYCAAHGFQALHPFLKACNAELVAGCHGVGLAVRAYTVDDRGEAERLFALGVDGLFTNRPADVVAWQQDWAARHPAAAGAAP